MGHAFSQGGEPERVNRAQRHRPRSPFTFQRRIGRPRWAGWAAVAGTGAATVAMTAGAVGLPAVIPAPAGATPTSSARVSGLSSQFVRADRCRAPVTGFVRGKGARGSVALGAAAPTGLLPTHKCCRARRPRGRGVHAWHRRVPPLSYGLAVRGPFRAEPHPRGDNRQVPAARGPISRLAFSKSPRPRSQRLRRQL